MVLDYLLNTLQRYEKNLRYANFSGGKCRGKQRKTVDSLRIIWIIQEYFVTLMASVIVRIIRLPNLTEDH